MLGEWGGSRHQATIITLLVVSPKISPFPHSPIHPFNSPISPFTHFPISPFPHSPIPPFPHSPIHPFTQHLHAPQFPSPSHTLSSWSMSCSGPASVMLRELRVSSTPSRERLLVTCRKRREREEDKGVGARDMGGGLCCFGTSWVKVPHPSCRHPRTPCIHTLYLEPAYPHLLPGICTSTLLTWNLRSMMRSATS